MNKKITAIVIGIFLIGLLIFQLQEVANAQLADEPITGPITSPLTSPTATNTPTLSPTVTPTPTLITTVSTTPVPTESPTPTPSVSPTPTESLTPTPILAPGTKLGGLDLDSYCTSTGNPGLQLSNGTWSCANGSVSIDMTSACKWQYGTSNVVANQDISNNPWSWTCYVPPVPASPTPTETLTPSPSNQPENVSPTLTPTFTPTPEQTAQGVSTHHYTKFYFPTFHFPKGFPFVFTNSFFSSSNFFSQPTHVEVIHAKVCTNHSKQ